MRSRRIDVDGDTTVVVVLPYYLGESTVERLLDHTADAHTWSCVGAGPGVADAFGVAGGGSQVALGDGRDGRVRRPALRGAHPRGGHGRRSTRTATASTASAARSCSEPGTGWCSSAPTRRSPTTRSCAPTTPRSRCGCWARTTGWSGTSRRSTTSSATTGSACRQPAAPLGPARARGSAGLALLAVDRLARPPARRAGRRAAAGRRTRRRDHPQPGRLYRRAGDRGHAAASLRRAARSRLRRTAAAGLPARPGRRWSARWRAAPDAPETEVAALLSPPRRRTVHRPRPDHPGQAAGRARQRGTPHMTETPDARRRRPRAARGGACRGRQGRGRAGRRRVRAARRAAVRRPRADGGRARHREDAAGAHPRRALVGRTPGGCSSPRT